MVPTMSAASFGQALDPCAENSAQARVGALAAMFDRDVRLLAIAPDLAALLGVTETIRKDDPMVVSLPASWANAARDAAQGRTIRLARESIQAPDGRQRLISATMQPWPTPDGGAAILLVCTDETALCALERANEIVLENLSIATRTAHCGVWRLDLKNRTVWVTPEYEEIIGARLGFEDLISPNPAWLFAGDLPRYQEFLGEITGPSGRASIEHRLAAAPETWIHATCERISDSSGATHAFVGMARNITERKRAELELIDATRRATESLEAKRTILNDIFKDLGVVTEPEACAVGARSSSDASSIAELTDQFLRISSELASRDAILTEAIQVLRRSRAEEQKASTAKSQFLLTMTHELRTPLNVIIGYSELALELAREQSDATASRDIERVLSAGSSLRDMVEAILDLTKLEAGDLVVETSPFDAAQVACETANRMRAAAAENRNELSIERREVGEAIGDRRRFAECLAHLLSNACKFTSGGQIALSMRRENGPHRDTLYFDVSDTGIGIAPEQLSNLFRPFVQVDATKTRAYGGAGIGLALARGIAQRMGGDITASSDLGRGSTFTLSLAAAVSADAAAA